MEYKFNKDPLFGKYCYIDTPWIAGKNTIYRIVNSGVRSNAWVEVPIRGRAEVVTHDHYEDVVYVVLDTLIDEDSRIKKFALKDIVIADTPQTDIHDLTDCDFCKDRNCKDCEGGKDEPQTAQKIAEFQKLCGIEIDPDRISHTDCGWK